MSTPTACGDSDATLPPIRQPIPHRRSGRRHQDGDLPVDANGAAPTGMTIDVTSVTSVRVGRAGLPVILPLRSSGGALIIDDGLDLERAAITEIEAERHDITIRQRLSQAQHHH
ncbi:MAG: hypothetical protein ACK4YU_14050, partial [Paracoccus sp. (in: a-proteobacteria)]